MPLEVTISTLAAVSDEVEERRRSDRN